jgi:hypothetical protein
MKMLSELFSNVEAERVMAECEPHQLAHEGASLIPPSADKRSTRFSDNPAYAGLRRGGAGRHKSAIGVGQQLACKKRTMNSERTERPRKKRRSALMEEDDEERSSKSESESTSDSDFYESESERERE